MEKQANEYQVGGTHYQSEYIHWDWVLNIGLGYLEGNATKYLARYDKKGSPLQDLKKARHYVVKAVECIKILAHHCRPPRAYIISETELFCSCNNTKGDARLAVMMLACWESAADLYWALSAIDCVIEAQMPKPVPLEDSNKHGDRAGKDPE